MLSLFKFFLGFTRKAVQHRVLGESLTVSKEYVIEFEFNRRTTIFDDPYLNILHMTSNGKNCCDVGSRVPAVFLGSDDPATAETDPFIQICTALNDNGNFCVNVDGYAAGKWIHIKIKQSSDTSGSYTFQVFIDGSLKKTAINNNPQEFTNVTLYAANPWDQAVEGFMRNFNILPGMFLDFLL